jgi:hypothetical protein
MWFGSTSLDHGIIGLALDVEVELGLMAVANCNFRRRLMVVVVVDGAYWPMAEALIKERTTHVHGPGELLSD